MTIKNIIFDWSGVILNDIDQAWGAMNYIFKHYNVKEMDTEEFKQKFFLPYMDFYEKYVPNITREELAPLFKKGIETAPKLIIYSGIKETLDKLKEKQIKMFVQSTHPQEEILKESKEGNIENYFEEIYGSLNNKKESIKEILNKNNLNPDETIFVGDMVHDIDTAKSASLKIAVVTYGYDSKEKLEKYDPDFILNKLDEIVDLIK